jgi:hypothetical protein
MVNDARADFAMLCSLLFLLLSGPGSWSLDRWWPRDVHVGLYWTWGPSAPQGPPS